MDRLRKSDPLRLLAGARLQALENIPSFSVLVDHYGLFCSSIKRDNFKQELHKIESFTDRFFKKNRITDITLQNQISFKAFLMACSRTRK